MMPPQPIACVVTASHATLGRLWAKSMLEKWGVGSIFLMQFQKWSGHRKWGVPALVLVLFSQNMLIFNMTLFYPLWLFYPNLAE